MENDFPQSLVEQNIAVPQDLLAKVMGRIIAKRKLQTRRRLFGTLILLLSSIAAAIPAGQVFWADITSSGLNLYLTLAWYDGAVIISNWQDFSFTILESLPVTSGLALLGAILTILLALKAAVKYYAKIYPASLLFKTTN